MVDIFHLFTWRQLMLDYTQLTWYWIKMYYNKLSFFYSDNIINYVITNNIKDDGLLFLIPVALFEYSLSTTG